MNPNRIRLQRTLRPHGKDAFAASLPSGARVFDIGCGNMSAQRTELLRPDLYYVGLDVQDYAQDAEALAYADEYRLTRAAQFLEAIGTETSTMDAVISSHNLEHCEEPIAVLEKMIGALTPTGRLYLSFPCEASLRFPRRIGSLNFLDDPTHRSPPNWQVVRQVLTQTHMRLEFAAQRYRPAIPAILGLVLEPVSALAGRVMPLGLTWALWGFESVIWAERDSSDAAHSSTARNHE